MDVAGPPSDSDVESLLLVAQLSLADLEEADRLRKEKGRAASPLSDEQLAIREQHDYLERFQLMLQDKTFAHSLNRALGLDQGAIDSIIAIDSGERDDREAALALSRGQGLPPVSQAQRSMAALAAALPSDPVHEESVAAEPEDEEQSAPEPHTMAASMSRSARTVDTPPPYSQSSKPPGVECIICTERKSVTRTLRAPCGHHYCRACLVDLVDAATRDESLFPIRCCQRSLPPEEFMLYLKPALHSLFRAKALEFGTPPASRLYCCNPTCSAFLGPSTDATANVVCPQCQTAICAGCKSAAHPGDACGVAAALVELKALAEAEHWQTCPGCGAMVELSQGCYHMTCRCRSQFCYLCAMPWKSCSCAQWDEHRLVNDAERRVLNEHGERAANIRPEQHARRVERAVEQLRINHACTDHRWRYRHGEGRCEECDFHLPTFLMRCANCQLLACRRCTQNRL